MDIDFVIAWVDGSDPAWRAEKRSYSGDSDSEGGNGDERYRDWNILQYWFRSVEQNAPWVRKIHFVTWGHLPKWLDTTNPKLHIVNHRDYIPEAYLPTFSSHTIELNLHRIKGLAEHFVYFNDDFFLGRKVKPSDFFRNGLPRDVAALNVHCYALDRPIQMISVRDTGVINTHFSMHDCMKKNILKWISPMYGAKLLRTFSLAACPRFPGFYISHNAQPYLKSSFEEVWKAEPEILDETCSHRFRQLTDVNQWVIKEWQIAGGKFYPQRASFSRAFFLTRGNRRKVVCSAAEHIRKKDISLICINDGTMSEDDLTFCIKTIRDAFQQCYPQKCSFER